MARVAVMGWEWGSIYDAPTGSAMTLVSTAPSIESTIVRSGAKSLKLAAASGTSSSISYPNIGSSFIKFYVRVTALPASSGRVLFGTIATSACNIRLNSTGTLQMYENTTSRVTSSTTLTDTSKWYCVEIGRSGTTNTLYIDGVSQGSGTVTNALTTVSFGPADTVAQTYTAYIDDYVSDTAALVGESKVILLLSTADSSVGSGWQKPGGGTTNLYTSVDNVPPVGIADSTLVGDAEKQIRNAGSNTNAYAATIRTYTAAGLTSDDTIRCVFPSFMTAAPSATSAKSGSLTLSNPTLAKTTFGTFYQGSTIAGTYPSGWKQNRAGNGGTALAVDNPTVTLGTAPVFTITQDTSSTRIAMVCAVGLYVEYVHATQTAAAVVSLAGANIPSARTSHVLHIRARVTSGTGKMRVALYEGANNRSGDLETGSLTTSLADYTLPISDANAANITDYSNLDIKFWGYSANAGSIVYEVDQAWLTLPSGALIPFRNPMPMLLAH
jgi:hypothetical protein